MICPNKNLPEWKALEEAQPASAYYLWDKYQGQVPSNFYTSPDADLYGLESDNLTFDTETLNSVISFIDNIGVKINFTNFTREDALAGIDVFNQTILITDDFSKREKAWEKLPEEAAHWWYKLLKNSELKTELRQLALQSEKFKDLFEQDYGNYNNIDLLTEEAIGQLIAESIKRIETNRATAKDKSFWQKFKDFVNKILGKYKEYQKTPFDTAAEKLLNSDLSELFTLQEMSQMYSDHIGESVFIETDVANDSNVISDIDYSKTFKSLMTRLKKRKRQPTEKTVQKIKDALSKDSKLKTAKLNKDFKELYNVEDIRPSLLSFEKFSQKYQKGIPAKDNLSLDGVKAFDISVYNAVRDLVKEYAPEIITKNTIPYYDFIGFLNEFLEKNYLLNFQVLKGYEDYRVYNTFLDSQTRHRKIGLRFNDEYFQERSHFSHSPLAWGNITYFKSNPSLAEPDSVLIHEIQNDFFERLTDNPVKNANNSVEEIMNLPSLFKGLADNNPELAYSQFKSKIKEIQQLINRDGLQKAIEYYRELIEQTNKEITYGLKINDEFAETLFNFIKPNVVGYYEDIEGNPQQYIQGYKVGEDFDSIIANEFERIESMRDFLKKYGNLILGATFKNMPKSPSQLKFLLNLKIKKAAARDLIIYKNQLLSKYKAKSKLDAADNYDNLPFENFLELYDSVQYNKNFLMGDLARNLKTQTIQKTELWSKYFNPLVHHLIQTVIKEKGRDFKIYFPSHDIVMLSQVQLPNEKTKTPTADLYAGEEDVRQGKVKETGVMYRNMKKVNGVSLEFVDNIPGFVNPVYGYKIDVSKYNYQTPILFGLDKSQKNGPELMPTEDLNLLDVDFEDCNG
jgi:hypothetical protein